MFRCILRPYSVAKCACSRGSAPVPAGGSSQCLPDLAGFKLGEGRMRASQRGGGGREGEGSVGGRKGWGSWNRAANWLKAGPGCDVSCLLQNVIDCRPGSKFFTGDCYLRICMGPTDCHIFTR